MSRPRIYPLDELERALRVESAGQVATQLGVTRRTVHRLRARGLTEAMADRYACRADLHPGTVWADWWE